MNETIKIFISSRQNELENERTWAKEAVEETGRDLGKCFLPILVEEKPTPPSTTTNTQCHEDLKESKAVICVYYKTVSEIVKNEFRWANEWGIPTFIFKKTLQEGEKADKELERFIKEEVRPPSGGPEGPYGTYVYKPFRGEDIKGEIKASLKKYYLTWFNLRPIPERYMPSVTEPTRLERTRYVYVKPHCYSRAEEKLKKNRLLIITGPAHLGKTSMAFYLADSFQENKISRRFLIFPEREDPSEIASFHDSVILFDDPFGGAIFKASLIADRFYKIQELARKNYIIITSRKEVLNEAIKYTKLGERNLENLTLEMRQADYYAGDFEEILAKHLEYFKVDQGMIALANSHKKEIIKELRFPHNYERLVCEELGKVIKEEKDFWQALKDAKAIERTVENWFERWYSKDKEVFYFLFILTLCGELGEENFSRIYKKGVERLNDEKKIGLPLIGNLLRLRKATASYVSQSGPFRLEHPSYKQGIMGSIEGSHIEDVFIVLRGISRDKESSVRSSAARILGEVGKKYPKDVMPFLQWLANDEILDVCFYTVLALGEMGDEHPQKVLPILKKLAKHEENGVRSRTALALGKMGKKNPTKILPILEMLAEDNVPCVRYYTAEALGEIGKEHPINILPMLEKLAEDKDPNVLSRTVRTLGEVGNEHPNEVIPILEELVLSKVYYDAIEVLGEMGKKYPEEILSILESLLVEEDPDVHFRAIEALVEVGKEHQEEVLPMLEKLARDEDPNVRQLTVRALREIGDEHPEEVLPILQKLAEDEDPDVSSHAAEALGRMNKEFAQQAITTPKVTIEEIGEEEPEVRFLTIEALGEAGNEYLEKALPNLERMAEDKDADVRYTAIEELRDVGKRYPTEVISMLKKLTGDKDYNVRSLAEDVLRELGLNKNK